MTCLLYFAFSTPVGSVVAGETGLPGVGAGQSAEEVATRCGGVGNHS